MTILELRNYLNTFSDEDLTIPVYLGPLEEHGYVDLKITDFILKGENESLTLVIEPNFLKLNLDLDWYKSQANKENCQEIGAGSPYPVEYKYNE